MKTVRLQDRLSTANPLALEALEELDLGAADEELLAAILGEAREAREAPARRRLPRLRPTPRIARLALPLVAFAVGAAVVVLSRGGTAAPALAEVLDDAAASAAQQAPTTPGPGQFLYVRSEAAYLLSTGYSPGCATKACPGSAAAGEQREWSVLVPRRRQVWLSFDGSRNGRMREVVGTPRFLSPSQRAGWEAAGSPPLPRAGAVDDTTLSTGSMIDTAGLPTDPPRLRARIEARDIAGVEGPPGEAETFVLIGDMLRESYLPAEFRAALYRVLGELPGVELLGEVEDPAGRSGIGVAYTDQRRATRHELIFDPATSALLAERETLVRPAAYGFRAPVGTTIGYAVYLESKVVDSVGSGAPAGAGGIDHSVGCYDRAAPNADVTVTHSRDPVAACAELWAKGIVDSPHGPASPPLVACVNQESATVVVPGSDPVAVCHRLHYAPWPTR